MFSYQTANYKQKREFIIQIAESFKSRGKSFWPLAEKIKQDEAYPEETLDYIKEQFDIFLAKTKQDNIDSYLEKSQQISHMNEEKVSEAELDDILSRLE